MGYFSWITADTNETIWVSAAQKPRRNVYLIQPNGQPPILETEYVGFGEFGEVNAYIWLAQHNLPASKLKNLDKNIIYAIGVALACDSYYEDTLDGSKHAVFNQSHQYILDGLNYHPTTYDIALPTYGISPNELIDCGRWVNRCHTVKLPLKFSFDENAVYEELPPSKSCPYQGFFEPDPDEQDI